MYFRNILVRRYNSQLLQAARVSPPSKHALSFTPAAVKRLSALAQMGDSLKIKVSSGGCHGYQYDLHLLKLTEQLRLMATPSDEEPMVFFSLPFMKPSAEDMRSLARSLKTPEEKPVVKNDSPEVVVSIDELSLELLDKTALDFKQELIGSQFKIVGGNMKSSCGCGSSFDI